MSQKNVKKDIVSEMSALKNLLQNYDNNEILTESDDLSKISHTILNTNDVPTLIGIIDRLETGMFGQSLGITDITKHLHPKRQWLIDFAEAKIKQIRDNALSGVDYHSKQ